MIIGHVSQLLTSFFDCISLIPVYSQKFCKTELLQYVYNSITVVQAWQCNKQTKPTVLIVPSALLHNKANYSTYEANKLI